MPSDSEPHEECDRRAADSARARGFALVELVVIVLVLGAVAAVVVFSVSGVTDHKTKTNACSVEVRVVQAAIVAYKAQHGGKNPKDLDALVTAGWLRSVPGLKTPSGAAGYSYDPTSGTYSGPACPA